jgi:hypothetical protein
MVPSMVNDIYIIRFAVCAKYANDDDMHVAFRTIQEHADIVMTEYRAQRGGRRSSSNDSLDLVSKQTIPNNNTEHDTAVSEETVNPELLPETSVAQTVYPPPKPRVIKFNFLIKILLFYFRHIQ